MIKLIECPRDAMQGIHDFIPTEKKAKYINALLEVGFDTIDFGSFVSPKAIPQMQDTADVLNLLELDESKSKLLAIIANFRGAKDASQYEEIHYLGFPFSISETFQLRNTNSTIAESYDKVRRIAELAHTHGKEMVVYISMGFGNPYGDPWNAEVVEKWVVKIHRELGVKIFALSDTIGVAQDESIRYIFSHLIESYPEIEFGAHFHTKPNEWREKINAAYESGCRRYDGAIKGYGGCPMAKDELTGNMPTENVIAYLDEVGVDSGIDMEKFIRSMQISQEAFPI